MEASKCCSNNTTAGLEIESTNESTILTVKADTNERQSHTEPGETLDAAINRIIDELEGSKKKNKEKEGKK